VLGELRLSRNRKFASRIQSKYPPRTDLSLGNAVIELKSLVNNLDTFSIENPSYKNITTLKDIIAVIEGMGIPEIVGTDNGKTQTGS